MIEIIIGTFIGALCGALFVDRQCKKYFEKLEGTISCHRDRLILHDIAIEDSYREMAQIINYVSPAGLKRRKKT